MEDKNQEQLDENYTDFSTESGSPTAYTPTGRFGQWLAKFFSRRGRPPSEPNREVRGDAYKAEETLELGGPGVMRGVLKLPTHEYERKKRYSEYEDMDTYPEIAAALDIYADDATQPTIEGELITVKCDQDFLKQEILRLFENIEVDKIIWDITRNVAKYGDCFMETIFNLKHPTQGIKRIKILNPNYILRSENSFGYLKTFIQEIPKNLNMDLPQYASTKKHILLDKNQLVHFRIHNADPAYYPYGKSILAAAVKTYRSLKLMEEAMLVYRLMRAPERRVFYIDVGNMPATKAESFVERQKAKFKKEKFYDPQKGTIDERYNPLSADEDYFVPIRKDAGKGARVETLPGAQNLGEVDDVKYFRDKLLASLKIPKDYIVEQDSSGERKANLSQLDVKFSRAVVRLQREVEIALTSLVRRHLKLRQFPSTALKDFKIQLSPPSDMYEKRRLELDDAKIRIVQAAKSLSMFSDEHIYKTYFGMSDEDIDNMKNQMEDEAVREVELQAKLAAAAPTPAMPGEGMPGMGMPGMEGLPGEEGGPIPPEGQEPGMEQAPGEEVQGNQPPM